MDTKNFLLASLAGGIVFFVSGFLFYGVLLSDFMVAGSAEGVMKETPDFVPLILSQLIFGAFLTMVLRRWPELSSKGRRRERYSDCCWDWALASPSTPRLT